MGIPAQPRWTKRDDSVLATIADPLLHEQLINRNVLETGARRLIRAILVDSVLAVIGALPRRESGTADNARDWIREMRADIYPVTDAQGRQRLAFGFAWCCMHVGLDPARTARAILRLPPLCVAKAQYPRQRTVAMQRRHRVRHTTMQARLAK